MKIEIEASDDAERDYLLQDNRCTDCGHLIILHNYHCCSFCNVPDCEC